MVENGPELLSCISNQHHLFIVFLVLFYANFHSQGQNHYLDKATTYTQPSSQPSSWKHDIKSLPHR